jgi:hypothetical protein
MSNLVVKKLQIRKVRRAARPNLVTPLTSVKVPTNGDSVSKSLGLVLDEARKKRFPMALVQPSCTQRSGCEPVAASIDCVSYSTLQTNRDPTTPIVG